MGKCEIEECKNKVCYGIKKKFATRCKQYGHAEKGMVFQPRTYCSHERRHNKCEDCKDDLICGFNDCENKSTYGKKQEFPTRCKIKEHQKEGMVVNPRVYCLHDRVCSICKECKGGSICLHNRILSRCRECKGSSFCLHNRIRSKCRECQGASICSHNRMRITCYICQPESNYFCIRRYSNGTRCTTIKNPKYDKYCVACFVAVFPDDSRTEKARIANEELKVRQYFNTTFPNRFIHNRQLFIADREKKCTSFNRRLDFQAEFDDCVLVVEVDENQHKYYDPMDEELRIMQIYQNADKNLIFIRFNPVITFFSHNLNTYS